MRLAIAYSMEMFIAMFIADNWQKTPTLQIIHMFKILASEKNTEDV